MSRFSILSRLRIDRYIMALLATVAVASIAKGNVAAAICSASFSTLIGIVLTPLLVALLLSTGISGNRVSLDSVRDIIVQLLVPFVAGQLLRRWIGDFVTKTPEGARLRRAEHNPAGGLRGLWQGRRRPHLGRLTPMSLMLLLMANIVLLAIAAMTAIAARRLMVCAWLARRWEKPSGSRLGRRVRVRRVR